MKYCHIFLFALLVLFTSCATERKGSPQEFSVVQNGHSDYQIVLPDHFENSGIQSVVTECAVLLKKAFLKSSGADIPLTTESKMNPTKPAIFIGNTEHIRKIGVLPATFLGMDYILASDNRNIYIAGNDRHNRGRKGTEKHYIYFYIAGSVKAMTVFMEQYMGGRFLMPGETGIEIPHKENILFPAFMKKFTKAPLEFAVASPINFIYDYSNNDFGHITYLMHGGHSYYSAVPLNKYAKIHPEYFILREGKRDLSHGHLCISNPEVQNLIYECARKALVDDGLDGTEIGQTDGFTPCECKNCQAYGNTRDWGEKLWILHRSIAERLQKTAPGKFAVIISYGPTFNPPKSFDSFPDNVIIELCNYKPSDFEKWKKIKVPGGFSAYVYNWGQYLNTGCTPSQTPRSVWKQLKLFRENNVRGILRCGFGVSFGMEGPVYYVYGKLLDSMNQGYEALADEYYQNAFKEAYCPMKNFYETLYKRLDAHETLKKEDELPDNPRPLLTYIYSPELLASMEHSLSRAEKKASSEVVKKRLALIRLEFDYVKHTAEVLQLYNAYQIRPGKKTFELLSNAIDERNAYIDSLFDAKGNKKPIVGWPEMEVFRRSTKDMLRVNGILSAQLETPLNWNTKTLREKNLLPGVGVRSAKAMKAEGEIYKDNFDAGAWKRVSWQSLAGHQGGDVSKNTRFKVLYDKKNLYIGIESELDTDKKFTSCGHDSIKTYSQDCIELMIDPLGTREHHYHLLYNPIPDSRYDRAFALIKDPLDPRYNKPDPHWTGKWSYSTVRKNGKWFSVVTIPYETINAEEPDFTSVWTLNIGRVIRDKVTNEGEYTLWAPQMGLFDFSDRASFGELEFE